MNVERIQNMIEIMKNAANLNMAWFQQAQTADGQLWMITTSNGTKVETIEELHTCGSVACFADYMAMSPMFRAAGGLSSGTGAPKWRDRYWVMPEDVVAEYLDIRPGLASQLIFGFKFYGGLDLDEVKPEHVIDALERILSGELT